MRRVIFMLLLCFTSVQAVLAQDECPTPEVSTTPVRFAYIEEGDLWLWDIHSDPTEEQPLRLIDSDDISRVDISDDGQVVAFLRQLSPSQHELWAVNTDGSDERLLVSAEQFATMRTETPTPDGYGVYQWAWIPDTHTLAFNTRVFYADGLYIAIADDLWTVDADSGELTNVLPAGEGGEFLYSPDGSQIAVMTPDSLSFVNADGSNRRNDVFEDFVAVGFGEYYVFPRVQWMQDNRTFWLIVNDSDDPYSASEGVVRVLHIDAETLEETYWLTTRAFYPSVVQAPDAMHIAYWYEQTAGSNMRHLLVTDEAGNSPFVLSGELMEFIAWSPDAVHFIFRDEDRQLKLSNLCGILEPIVQEDSSSASVTWIDSGRYLVRFEGGELWLNALDGSSTLLSSVITNFDFVVGDM